MPLTNHARVELAILGVLLLGSFQQQNDQLSAESAYNLADVANFRARRAIGAANDLDHRIDEIESRLNI